MLNRKVCEYPRVFFRLAIGGVTVSIKLWPNLFDAVNVFEAILNEIK